MGLFDDPTGLICFSLIAAAIAAVPISRAILAHYRRRIDALMREGGAPAPEPHVERPGPRAELILAREPTAEADLPAPPPSARTLTLVYAAAGLAWAVVATVLTFSFNQIEPSPGRILALGAVFLWPAVPLVARVGGWGRRAELLAPLGVLGMSLFLGALLGGDVARATLIAWAVTMLPPTATFLLVSWLGVPSVGPWVAGFLGAVLLAIYVGLAGIVSLGGASNTVVATLLLATLAASVFVGRGVVRLVARLFLQKKVSVEMLWADVWWAVFTGWLCIWFSVPGETAQARWLGVLAGALPFVVYRGVVALGIRTLGPASPGPRLLLLRVFGHRGRSERLLGSVGRRWRRGGSIQLIAAPDTAAATLDPQELLEFVAGRLDDAFVKDASGLEARLADLDVAADPDGTYRVTEFFCQDDAWRMTLQRLARDASAVLMDLRGFGPDNAGCIYELGQLVDLVPTECTVLIVDESTDEAFLVETLRGVWAKLRADSPNRSEAPSPLRVVDAGREGPDPSARILGALAEVLHRQLGSRTDVRPS
jgi:hypothetical protein